MQYDPNRGYPPPNYGPGPQPYPQQPPVYPNYQHLRPHRGGMILTLGILSIVLCQLLGPFAWSMGSSDLNAMDRGEMDPMGRGTTQAGKITGIIGTIFLIISLLIIVLQFVLGVAILGAAASSTP